MTPDATWMFCSRSAASTSPGVERQMREPLGVEPDAHAVLAQSERRDVADAVDAGQRVAHLNQRVVADVELIEALVRRDQVDDHQQVGRRLERRHAQPADVLRQPRLGDRDAVLHEHLGLVEIGAEPERDRQRHRAVGRALRRHVEHVFDAVHFLLDRRGDRLGDHFRRRARVGWPERRSSAARRRDTAPPAATSRRFRRGSRSTIDSTAAKDRPVDKEVGDAHGSSA